MGPHHVANSDRQSVSVHRSTSNRLESMHTTTWSRINRGELFNHNKREDDLIFLDWDKYGCVDGKMKKHNPSSSCRAQAASKQIRTVFASPVSSSRRYEGVLPKHSSHTRFHEFRFCGAISVIFILSLVSRRHFQHSVVVISLFFRICRSFVCL